jgi:hypothetical protein
MDRKVVLSAVKLPCKCPVLYVTTKSVSPVRPHRPVTAFEVGFPSIGSKPGFADPTVISASHLVLSWTVLIQFYRYHVSREVDVNL